ncbi:flagellar biosynthetic protein FliO [Roseomonas xinghualingensis]|uniref:flagellar biosynthetic protein FliO n=1 Tax=Roseomonas xinghualingensis TaxID=2986475 RepID=UPI0021F1A7A5|nr:flagellar biosynthetic protein FliO [Roseomonas sp. SXEYE001]MCV4208039.1 flagellar biosynthetic protein FliO [Roseomonas sp. SXEYE001]
MTGGAAQWSTAAGALALVLGLLWLVARLARRGGLATSGPRRIRIVETTPIDTRRRAVILRVDGREALIVTGGPQDCFIGWL